jgi:hypothetical protein
LSVVSQETSTVKKGRNVLVVAMALYVASFLLSAVIDEPGSPNASRIPGYTCAYLTLLMPWAKGLRVALDHPLQFISLLLKGWIFLYFLVTVALLLRRATAHIGGILRIVLLLMFPACWLVFSDTHLRPSYGYFVWAAAMVAAVFSASAEHDAESASR